MIPQPMERGGRKGDGRSKVGLGGRSQMLKGFECQEQESGIFAGLEHLVSLLGPLGSPDIVKIIP